MPEARTIDCDCPYCGAGMAVARMRCDACGVEIAGEFPRIRLGGMAVEHQRFIEMFVLSGGNLKEMAEQVGVSYPTIRSRLDKVIDALRAEIGKTRTVKGNVLDAVEFSRKSAEEAARLIKEI